MLLQSFDDIADILLKEDRSALVKAATQAEKEKGVTGQQDLAETNVGVLRIEGALTNKPTMFGALCGMASYQELIEQTEELCAMENINTIMMLQDSGGGEAFNMMPAAMQVKSMCEASGKKLIAYVDGISASASFGWSAVADEIIAHPDSQVGSVGVVVRLANDNRKQKQDGIETTYITAGASKVPFDKEGEFKEDFIADMQERVDELYLGFVSHVASNRNISEEAVMDTEAKMFSARKAVELGLVDKIMNNEEFYSYLADIASPEQDGKTNSKTSSSVLKLEEAPSKTSMEHNMPDNKVEASVDVEMTEKLAQFETMQTQFKAQLLAEQADLIASFKAEKAEAEQANLEASVSEKLSSYAFLADSKDGVVAFLANADVSEAHKELLNSVLSEAQLSVDKTIEESAEKLAESQLAVEAANKEKEDIKEEFGTGEIGVAGAVVEPADHKAQLAAHVAKQKANKKA